MVHQVVILPKAQADLASIGDFIAPDNPERAISYVEELLERTRILANFPELGRRSPEHHLANCREIVFNNYRVFYRVRADKRLVEVLRFWHAARGTPSLR